MAHSRFVVPSETTVGKSCPVTAGDQHQPE
jgi:hypothetical protein